MAVPSSPSAAHRLPTVSASQALQDLQHTDAVPLSTGLASLDAALSATSDGDTSPVGLERGKVTEVWGPSGAGKTAMALTAAACCVEKGDHVVWIDASTPLSGSRLQTLFSSSSSSSSSASPSLDNFHHTYIPTLSHLLALILHPPPSFPPRSTSLLILDGLSHLLDRDYPRYNPSSPPSGPGTTRPSAEDVKFHSARRYTMLGTLATAFGKLASLHRLAVLVTTACSTRTRPGAVRFGSVGGGSRAFLVPGVGGAEWDAGVWNRLVVFRDVRGRRFCGVQKCRGRRRGGGAGGGSRDEVRVGEEEIGDPGWWVLGVEIGSEDGRVREERGKRARGEDASAETSCERKVAAVAVHDSNINRPPPQPRKRVYDEIADSEGEDEYGWGEMDDDAVALATAAEGLLDDSFARDGDGKPDENEVREIFDENDDGDGTVRIESKE